MCLYQSETIEEVKAEGIGWGATSVGGKSSDELLKADLDLFSIQECSESYSPDDDDDLPQGIISSQLCAGDVTRQRDTW